VCTPTDESERMKRVTKLNLITMEKKSKSAEKRWVAYVKKCEQLKTFDCYAVRKEYGVDARLINTLIELGWVISAKRGKYNWIWQYPLTEKDINNFINTHRK